MSDSQVARMTFNSINHDSVKGLRGSAESQQIVFETDDVSIHLRISMSDRERIILGQLLQRAPGGFVRGATVNLECADASISSTLTNSIGEFRFKGVATGALTLQAEIPGKPRILATFKVSE